MAFWSGETLSERLPDLVDPFDPSAIDCAAYTLRLGREIYISPDAETPNPSRHTAEIVGEGEGIAIPPGQFAFLTAAEDVVVPDDAIAFISIKARVKFLGLVNISGFHVDPGYRGRLLFSVLNAGPRPIHLRQGQGLFLIWYADLDAPTRQKKGARGFDCIEPGLINGISGEILSLQSLFERQRMLEAEVAKYKTRVTVWTTIVIGVLLLLIGLALAPTEERLVEGRLDAPGPPGSVD